MPVGELSFVYAYIERKPIPHCRISVRSIRVEPLGAAGGGRNFHANGGINEQNR
jgi:hypothetical protein